MKKYVLDLIVSSVDHLTDKYILLKLTHDEQLPMMSPGQFVEIKVENSPQTMLRRPISIHYVDEQQNQLWLLVACVGEGTRHLARIQSGDRLNCVLPLGTGFTLPSNTEERILLVGGGVGIAPLLYFGKQIKQFGAEPTFLLGGRSASDLLELDLFRRYGNVSITTEDGTLGEKGFVTEHSILGSRTFTRIVSCGPKPMMMAVARYARQQQVPCEVSLENLMACGLGACLCCVEKTTEGHVCVCTEGPVFNIDRLLWD